MKTSIKSQILARIKQKEKGWAFSALDFICDFERREIDESLSTLSADGDIRRIFRGVYDVPMYSALLGRTIAPNMDQVAAALARKFKWDIYPDGNTALNYLGLSTQMVSKHVFLSNGPSRKYDVDGVELQFKHKALRELSLNGNRDAVLLVHAIRAMGESHMDERFIQSLSTKFTATEWNRICHDTCTGSAWIHAVIKKASSIKNKEYETNSSGA